jgi:hypothetical protein
MQKHKHSDSANTCRTPMPWPMYNVHCTVTVHDRTSLLALCLLWYSFMFRYADTSIHKYKNDLQHFLGLEIFGSFSSRFDFFASFRSFPACFHFASGFLLFRFNAKQAKTNLFPSSKRNEIFTSISIFRKPKTRVHLSQNDYITAKISYILPFLRLQIFSIKWNFRTHT